MKKFVALLSACLLLFVPCVARAAYSETLGSLTWGYIVSSSVATITDVAPVNGGAIEGTVTVPGRLGGYPVTGIEMYAFEDCSGLTSVTIPDSVTSIGYRAFRDCSSLVKITVAKDNPRFKSVNGMLLTKDGKELLRGVNGKVAIPPGVEKIGDSAFYGLSGLTGVTIPSSVTSIGDGAFRGCSDSLFDTTTIPGVKLVDGWAVGSAGDLSGNLNLTGIRGIGGGAFYWCRGLTSVTIPSSVTSIGDCAFYWCSGLTSVTIPDSVTSIGSYAFYDCSGLTSVTIPDSVTSIGSYAFSGCSGLTSVTIPGSVTSIWREAFASCSRLTSVTISEGVTSIGSRAFYGCSRLTSVMIPDSVTSIGDRAFSGCSDSLFDTTTSPGVELVDGWAVGSAGDLSGDLNLTGIRGIVNEAFFGCSGLASVTIPDSVTSIGEYAFAHCSSLVKITVAKDNPRFKSVNGMLLTKDGKKLLQGVNGKVAIPPGVEKIGDSAFYWCSGLTSVTIPSSVTSIGDCAFYWCSGLTCVTIPDSVTSIGEGAFLVCRGLTSVTIPGSVTSIGGSAFCDCSGLTSVTIPDSVTSIGDGAFAYCSGLTSVRLPKRLEGHIDESVFDGCPGTLTVTYYESPYTVRFHRNDASDEKTAAYDFDYCVETRLPSLAKLGWAKRGLDFVGWGKYPNSTVVWKSNWANVTDLAYPGETVDLYAMWAVKPGGYAIEFVRNDGAGTWRTVGFNYGEKTRIPSLANGLGWARRGYDFKGWALTTADANAGKVWKEDWAYVATPVRAGKVLTVYAVWALKPGYYQIRFNKNDGTGKWRTLGFQCDASTKLSTISGLGWERPGYTFKGWASNAANAAAGKVWKTDGEWVKNAAAEGRTLSVYAIWR